MQFIAYITQILGNIFITAYAKSTNTTQKQENDSKTKSIESTKEFPVEAISESIEESSKNDSSQEVTASSETPEKKLLLLLR